MRKLKLQVQMTVDGFIAGPNGEMDFGVWDWDDALKQYVTDLTAPVDCGAARSGHYRLWRRRVCGVAGQAQSDRRLPSLRQPGGDL